jgi:hypothetical protein
MDSLNHYFDISERKIFLPGGLDTFLLIRRCFARRRGGNTLTEGPTSTAHSDGFARGGGGLKPPPRKVRFRGLIGPRSNCLGSPLLTQSSQTSGRRLKLNAALSLPLPSFTRCASADAPRQWVGTSLES